jgi:hypothetical protein
LIGCFESLLLESVVPSVVRVFLIHSRVSFQLMLSNLDDN